MVLFLCICSQKVAASTLEVGVETDRQEYKSGDSIQIRINYANESPATLEGVHVEISNVTGAELSLENKTLSKEQIAPKESGMLGMFEGKITAVTGTVTSTEEEKTQDVSAEVSQETDKTMEASSEAVKSVKTKDSSGILCTVAVLAVSAAVFVVCLKRKKGRQLLAIILCTAMAGSVMGSYSTTAYAQESANAASVYETKVLIDGKEAVIAVNLTYDKMVFDAASEEEQAQLNCADVVAAGAKTWTVTVQSENVAFAQELSVAQLTLDSAFTGMTIESVERISDSEVRISGYGTMVQPCVTGCGQITFAKECFAGANVSAADVSVKICEAYARVQASDISQNSYENGVLTLPVNINYADVYASEAGESGFSFVESERAIVSVQESEKYNQFLVGIAVEADNLDGALAEIKDEILHIDSSILNCGSIELSMYGIGAYKDIYAAVIRTDKTDETPEYTVFDFEGEIHPSVIDGTLDKLAADDLKLTASIGKFGNVTMTSVTPSEFEENTFSVKLQLTVPNDKLKTAELMIENDDYSFLEMMLSIRDGKAKQYWGTVFPYREQSFYFAMTQLGGADNDSSFATELLTGAGKAALSFAAEKLMDDIMGIPSESDQLAQQTQRFEKLRGMLTDIYGQITDLHKIASKQFMYVTEIRDNTINLMYRQNTADYNRRNTDLLQKAQEIQADYVDENGMVISRSHFKEQFDKVVNASSVTKAAAEYEDLCRDAYEELGIDFARSTAAMGISIVGTNGSGSQTTSIVDAFDNYYMDINNLNFYTQATTALNNARKCISATYMEYWYLSRFALEYGMKNGSESEKRICQNLDNQLKNQVNKLTPVLDEIDTSTIRCRVTGKYYDTKIDTLDCYSDGLTSRFVYEAYENNNPTSAELDAMIARSQANGRTLFYDMIDAGFEFHGSYNPKIYIRLGETKVYYIDDPWLGLMEIEETGVQTIDEFIAENNPGSMILPEKNGNLAWKMDTYYKEWHDSLIGNSHFLGDDHYRWSNQYPTVYVGGHDVCFQTRQYRRYCVARTCTSSWFSNEFSLYNIVDKNMSHSEDCVQSAYNSNEMQPLNALAQYARQGAPVFNAGDAAGQNCQDLKWLKSINEKIYANVTEPWKILVLQERIDNPLKGGYPRGVTPMAFFRIVK